MSAKPIRQMTHARPIWRWKTIDLKHDIGLEIDEHTVSAFLSPIFSWQILSEIDRLNGSRQICNSKRQSVTPTRLFRLEQTIHRIKGTVTKTKNLSQNRDDEEPVFHRCQSANVTVNYVSLVGIMRPSKGLPNVSNWSRSSLKEGHLAEGLFIELTVTDLGWCRDRIARSSYGVLQRFH